MLRAAPWVERAQQHAGAGGIPGPRQRGPAPLPRSHEGELSPFPSPCSAEPGERPGPLRLPGGSGDGGEPSVLCPGPGPPGAASGREAPAAVRGAMPEPGWSPPGRSIFILILTAAPTSLSVWQGVGILLVAPGQPLACGGKGRRSVCFAVEPFSGGGGGGKTNSVLCLQLFFLCCTNEKYS